MGSERLFVLGWTYNLIKAGFDVSVVGLRILDCFSDGNVRSSFFFRKEVVSAFRNKPYNCPRDFLLAKEKVRA
jgi:hypothetical protein